MTEKNELEFTDLLFRMVGINTNRQTIDLILRTQKAFKELGPDGFTLRDACKLKVDIERKYDRLNQRSRRKYQPTMLHY